MNQLGRVLRRVSLLRTVVDGKILRYTIEYQEGKTFCCKIDREEICWTAYVVNVYTQRREKCRRERPGHGRAK